MLLWLSKAAEQDEKPGVQFLLGNCYHHGHGVPEDTAKALAWYRKAAEQGYCPAQRALGGMYYRGESVPTDYVQCYAWISLAAAQGEEESRKAKNALTSVMTTEQIAEAQKLSGEYWDLYGSWQPDHSYK